MRSNRPLPASDVAACKREVMRLSMNDAIDNRIVERVSWCNLTDNGIVERVLSTAGWSRRRAQMSFDDALVEQVSLTVDDALIEDALVESVSTTTRLLNES